MSEPEQAELIDLLAEQWQALGRLVADLDEPGWRTPTALPGWTVFDVLAHVIGTESWLLGERPPAADPLRPKVDVRELPHVRNETGVLNEIWVDRLRPLPPAGLFELYTSVTERRTAALRALDAEAWAAMTPSPIGEVSYGRFMRVRLFDCWMHEIDIADALGVTVAEGGCRGEVAFQEFLGSIPRVLVKRGQAPDGARIEIELSGALARTLRVAVTGRAGFVDALDGPPDAAIALDSGLFTRLGGGRTPATAHEGEIALRGDTELGKRLVRSLAFTI
ncbi:maleylpyruvate isomerase family mycothiol-dependent enzyme [Nocardia asteroides]|uniref:maleylpyruvate isomerase family mycothiol-dependent enzyme n=1 Tax=Nocardia asteroides TaxID=1824 RepID=UPI001E350FD4|nr:maleylpyruvate isomerase family mycothiol-dependent enzyme [Nocardia asteroides]UGT60172.1 maleylpyruvate isomerase family mycothiol-dependent enzyme [Nocardia asteroides]